MTQHVKTLTTVVCAWLLIAVAGCSRKPSSKQYPIEGQVLTVDSAAQQITLKHGDIPGFMPAMTMSYPVASPQLLEGRTPGELVRGTLEMSESGPKLLSLAHVGSAALPDNSNEVALASGVIAVGDAVPDAVLVDEKGRRRSFSEWKGSITLLTFVYTRCPLPDFCPLIDQRFATIQRRLAATPSLAGHIKLVTVSFDPEHDTPQVLAGHAKRLKADPGVWTFLTGDRQTIDRFAARFGVGVMREPQDAQITHNLRTTLIDANGRVAKIYTGNAWSPEIVLADVAALAGRATR